MIQDLLKQVLGHHDNTRYGILKAFYKSQIFIYVGIMLICLILSGL